MNDTAGWWVRWSGQMTITVATASAAVSGWHGLPDQPSILESAPVALFAVAAVLGVRGVARIEKEGQ